MLRTRHRMQGRGGEGVVSGLASVRDRDVCGYATAAIRQAAGAGRTHRELMQLATRFASTCHKQRH